MNVITCLLFISGPLSRDDISSERPAVLPREPVNDEAWLYNQPQGSLLQRFGLLHPVRFLLPLVSVFISRTLEIITTWGLEVYKLSGRALV